MNVLPTPPRRRADRHRRRRLHARPRTLAGCGGISRRVRATGDPRLVHRRPHRRRLSARLLPGCDPRAPRRRAPVLERRPGHPPRARLRAPWAGRPGEQGSRSCTRRHPRRRIGRRPRRSRAAGDVATAGRGDTAIRPPSRTRPRRPSARRRSSRETRSSPTSVPYPILALAALAGVLLVAGGVGWLVRPRPLSASSPDR